jgi:hypothetical protein
MKTIMVCGEEKKINEYSFQLLLGTVFFGLVISSLLGLLGAGGLAFIIPMFIFYGYVFHMINLKKEKLILNDGFFSYFRGEARKIHAPVVSIKNMDTEKFQVAENEFIYESLFVIHFKDGSSISAPYKLLQKLQLEKFSVELMKYV